MSENNTSYGKTTAEKLDNILRRGIEIFDNYQSEENLKLDEEINNLYEEINNLYNMFGIQKHVKPEISYVDNRLLKNVHKEDLFLYLVDVILKESLSKEQYAEYLKQKHLIFNKQFVDDIFQALKQHVGDSFKNIPAGNNIKNQQQSVKVGIKK